MHSPADRDRDDLGRVFQALLDLGDLTPDQVVREYVSDDLRRTKNKDRLRVEAGIFQLGIDPNSVVAAGGGGIVLQCLNRSMPSIKYALKVVRPSLIKDRLSEAAEEQKRAITEFLNHAPLSHRNIARVFGAGTLTVTHAQGAKLPTAPILMEWIEGATPLCRFLADKGPAWQTAVGILIQCFEALDHLHSTGLIHWDMKADNLLVDCYGTPRLTDIGNARRLRERTDLTAFSTKWNVPPALLQFFAQTSGDIDISSRRTPIYLPDHSWDTPWLDLWMLGRELNRLFEADPLTLALDKQQGHPDLLTHSLQRESFLPSVFPANDLEASYALRYLRLIVRRLLHPLDPSADCFYATAGHVVADLKKLLQPLGAAHGVPELQPVPQHVLRLPVSGNVPYTPRFRAIYNSRLIQRLNNHLQLGTLAQVYPGATHRRAEHSAGVFATTIHFVRSLYANQTEPFWRLSIERTDIDALLVAALIHDAGHVAYGHFLEELEGLFQGRTHEDYVQALLSQNPTKGWGREILTDRQEIRDVIRQHWLMDGTDLQAFLDKVAEILASPKDPEVAHDSLAVLRPHDCYLLKTHILHSIIDSAIDADKLDYLLRDAHHCNVSYSRGIDVDRFYQSLTPIPLLLSPALNNKTTHACVGVSEKGITPLESILVARYQMFASVYWHHTARAETAMLQFVVQEFVSADAASVDQRLGEMIEVFRTLSDGHALRWIRDQVQRPDVTIDPGLRPVLASMCGALLGERDKLYWSAFEMRFAGPASEARELSEWIMAFSDSLRETKDALRAVARARDFRLLLGSELGILLERPSSLKYGDILVDLPPAGKDQIGNIFVAAGPVVRSIQELSPLADSVREAFRYWVRKLRVFVSPTAGQQLVDNGLNEERLHGAIWAALQRIRKAKNPQRELFPAAKAVQ
jgi:uncharacterized protein